MRDEGSGRKVKKGKEEESGAGWEIMWESMISWQWEGTVAYAIQMPGSHRRVAAFQATRVLDSLQQGTGNKEGLQWLLHTHAPPQTYRVTGNFTLH